MSITAESLQSLEAWSKARKTLRPELIAHRRRRSVALGEHMNLQFEDERTIRYQIQEMLRIEKIFEEDGITHELESYNPLVPDGRNFKATMMIEYPDADVRRIELGKLIGVEDRVWVQVEGSPRVYALADEDMERENADKTSAVHFLRFELTDEMAAALKYGVSLAVGVDHPHYQAQVAPVGNDTRLALLGDLS